MFVLISSYEANELLSLFNEKNAVKLFLLWPRFRVNKKRIISFPEIILPPIRIAQLAIFCFVVYFILKMGMKRKLFKDLLIICQCQDRSNINSILKTSFLSKTVLCLLNTALQFMVKINKICTFKNYLS